MTENEVLSRCAAVVGVGGCNAGLMEKSAAFQGWALRECGRY